MKKIFYVGLEPYESRYTLQLTDWNVKAFEKRGIEYEIVPGEQLHTDNKIHVGQVLDAHGRSYYALSQMMTIVKWMQEGKIDSNSILYFEDMFHPGFEALPYIIYQSSSNSRPDIWVRCLAQTIDPDDFVHSTGMQDWMRNYENIVNEVATGVLMSNEEMIAHAKIAGWKANMFNISGLAFDADEVRSRVDNITPWYARPKRIAFASRWDVEKQPQFFLDLIEDAPSGWEFVLLQGGPLKSNEPEYVDKARMFEHKGLLTIKENLSKDEYYTELTNCRVLFNCALQDWTSNTVSEADALGCNVVFPAYRSFPEIFANDETRMYVPWSLEDALHKLYVNMTMPNSNIGKISKWTSSTIYRILDIMGDIYAEGADEHYRKRVSERKYS